MEEYRKSYVPPVNLTKEEIAAQAKKEFEEQMKIIDTLPLDDAEKQGMKNTAKMALMTKLESSM